MLMESRTKGSSERTRPVEEILNAIGDPYARDVLALIDRKSRSAKEISDELEHSINTVYRRINLLKEHGLVQADMEIEADGNHHQIFETTFDGVIISVEDEEYDVEIYRRDDLPDRFNSLWDDLGRV